MPLITIQGTPVNFPDSSASPNWAPAVIQFAQLVETALASSIGPYDVSPQSFIADAYNPGTNVDLPNLAFPISTVRAAFIRYSVFRTTSTTTNYEQGHLLVIYNPSASVGNKWEITRDYIGDGKITFNITDAGQVQFSTTTMGGINHSARIAYAAQAFTQT